MELRMRFLLILALGVLAMGLSTAETEYLSDRLDLISSSRQGWGELGTDACAHAPGQTPLELQIKDVEYSKGLGHHAPGDIIVDLDGCYETFEAEIGVQKQSQGIGSVVFQVYADDEKRFDSGVMREQDAAKPVSIPVTGAQELRLLVTDAGDGITCDCANWANARLVPAKSPAPSAALGDRVNVAPFAQVITCDPERMDGARASRIEEFRAEDIFLETEASPSAKGIYSVPETTRCIGLKWPERRLLTEIGLRFAGEVPSTDGAQVQAWIGQTLHQGRWMPLKGEIEAQDHDWVFRVVRRDNPDTRNGVWKVRWIFPSPAKPVSVLGFSAFTRSIWKTADLLVEIENPPRGNLGRIAVYNGEIIGAPRKWDFAKPVALKVRYCASKRSSYDRTVLRFGGFGVAVDDVLTNECVYVPDARAFVTTQSSGLTLAEYKKQIAGRKTVLERVREMPDQTFAQAMAKTRNPIQDNGPTMISLACDNRKFVVEQNGIVRFALKPGAADRAPTYAAQFPCAVIPRFGNGETGRPERHLEGGWLPIIVSAWKQGDVLYRERCFVAPYDKTDTGRWLNNKPLCVTEFTIENAGDSPADASLTLSFFSDFEQRTPMDLRRTAGGAVAACDGRLTALVNAAELNTSVQDEKVSVAGKLPAGGKAKCFVYLPGWEMKPEESAQLAGGESLAGDVEAYWRRVMSSAMQIEIPDPVLSDVIRASQVHCLIAARNEENGERIAPWIASISYGPLESESNSIVRGMDFLGHDEFARRSLDFFIKRYSPQGYLTTGYTLMGTGWNLQTLGKHYQLTRDASWMKRIAPDVARVCEWINRQRKKTTLDGSGPMIAESGLMPPGVMADWGNFLHYFCLNGYYYAGLQNAAEALKDVGHPGADDFARNASEFRRDILLAYEPTQSMSPVVPLQNGTWVRWYPSQVYNAGPLGGFFPGEDGNRSWAYDVELGAHQLIQQGVLAPESKEAHEMMDHMEDVQFLADGWFDYPAEKNHGDWFNLGGFSKVQPYYCRNAEIYAMRDDVKPFIRSYFNTLASLLNTENLSLWEHFHSSGAWNKTHETGYFLQQTRFMLAMEHGDQLWLAPFVTSNWLKDGMVVAVRDAPTRFGKVSYRITSHAAKGFIEMTVEPPRRNPPKEIVIRLRHPEGKRMRSVTLNGRPHKGFDPDKETITLAGVLPDEVKLRVEY